MSNVCPVCEKDDKIKKIAAIYMMGRSTGNTMTDLARILHPPEEPEYIKPFSLKWSLVLVLGLILLIISLVFGPASNSALLGNLLFVLAIVGGVLSILGLVIAPIKEKSMKREYTKRNTAAKAAWKKRKEVYSRLFYCERDHIVFNPQSAEYQPLEKWQLLFK